MPTYLPKIEIGTLISIGCADSIGARMLWGLGLYGQALWLLQQSAEKLLKAAWLRGRLFVNEGDVEKKLKGFGHDIEKVFNALSPADRKKITHGIWLIKIDALRYKGSYGTSYKRFRTGELFIADVRKLLGLKKTKSHFADWERASHIGNGWGSQHKKMTGAAKAVLSAVYPESKKERRERQRKYEFAIRELLREMRAARATENRAK